MNSTSVRVNEASINNWKVVLQNIKDDCEKDLKNIQEIISNTLNMCDGNVAKQLNEIRENSLKDSRQTVDNIGTIDSFLQKLLETKINQ